MLRNTFASGNKGKPKTEEHKSRISAAQKGKPRPYAVGNTGWKANVGSKRSAETRERMRAAWVLRKARKGSVHVS
jgi:hypothetical protein